MACTHTHSNLELRQLMHGLHSPSHLGLSQLAQSMTHSPSQWMLSHFVQHEVSHLPWQLELLYLFHRAARSIFFNLSSFFFFSSSFFFFSSSALIRSSTVGMVTELNFFFSWLAKQTMSTFTPVTATRSLSSPSRDTEVTPVIGFGHDSN